VALGGQPGTDGTPQWAFVVQIYAALQDADAGQVLTADGAGGATWEDASGVEEAPDDGGLYGRQLEDWTKLGSAALADSGDFMPVVDPAVAGNLVTLAGDGTLVDAGLAKGTTQDGGIALGQGSSAGDGGASFGLNSSSTSGGGAVGRNSLADGGGAIGDNASTDTGGGAVGLNAVTSAGFAGGANARAIDGTTAIDAIQLGAGTNATANTLQIYGNRLLNADGSIPPERVTRPLQVGIPGTTHTLALTNEGQILASQSGDPTEFSIPLNSAAAFPVGAIVGAQQQGAGTLTIKAVAGVTLNGVDGDSKAITV